LAPELRTLAIVLGLWETVGMAKNGRYLHFENLDLKAENLAGECSSCRRTFLSRQNTSDSIDDVLLAYAQSLKGTIARGMPATPLPAW
jgi:hypothetical protein